MGGLIVYEGDKAMLSPEVAKKLADYERAIKHIKEQEDSIKADIKSAMEIAGVVSIDDQIAGLKVTYVAPYDKETFDSKKFKQDNPDLYDEYVRITQTKSSIRITVK